MPVLLIFAGALFYDPHILHMSDTLGGRIGWTMHVIGEIDFASLMGYGCFLVFYKYYYSAK